MIRLEGVGARHGRATVANVSASWDAGVHAIVGASEDGAPLLLAVVAGAVRARAGRVLVLGGVPSQPHVRRRIALVGGDPPLPEARSVGEAMDVAGTIRGEALSAEGRLAALGLEALAGRRPGTLSCDERRAVTLAEALTSTVVRAILVYEPFMNMDPRAASRMPRMLRERASAGCDVVVATASERDACELADDAVRLKAGAVTAAGSTASVLAGAGPARLRILGSDPVVLMAALAHEEDVQAVARRGDAVVASGKDPLALARAAARAIVTSGVDVVELRVERSAVGQPAAAGAEEGA